MTIYALPLFVLLTTKIVSDLVSLSFLGIRLAKMNRLFGKGKPKGPAPNLTDCIAGVSMFKTIV